MLIAKNDSASINHFVLTYHRNRTPRADVFLLDELSRGERVRAGLQDQQTLSLRGLPPNFFCTIYPVDELCAGRLSLK